MTPAVEVRDLFCLYRGTAGDVAAVRGLSLVVEPGERVVVQGPNGSGKTTLLRVLLGEQRPSAGLVHIGGQSVRAWVGTGGLADAAGAASRARQRGRSIGYVEQNAARVLRPEISVLDNVALQMDALADARQAPAREQAGEVLDRLGLAAFSARQPDTLSGGEAQRVGVAAAIAHGPSLLLADEPSGALDRATADGVYDLLSEAATSTGAALLLVSHDDGAARVADRVVRIRDGRVSEQWEPGHAQETLVVDDRGWVRLPEVLRRSTGALSGVVASLHDGAIRLVGTDGPLSHPRHRAPSRVGPRPLHPISGWRPGPRRSPSTCRSPGPGVRSSTASTSRFPPVRSPWCMVAPVRARARCCACSPGWTAPSQVGSRSPAPISPTSTATRWPISVEPGWPTPVSRSTSPRRSASPRRCSWPARAWPAER